MFYCGRVSRGLTVAGQPDIDQHRHEARRHRHLKWAERPAPGGPPATRAPVDFLAQLGPIGAPMHGRWLGHRAPDLGDQILELVLPQPAHLFSPPLVSPPLVSPPLASPTRRLSAEYARCRCTRTVASDTFSTPPTSLVATSSRP